MSKAGKRGKSAAGAQGGAKWEQGLLAAQFEEDKWKPNITFVVGKQAEDFTWINTLGSNVQSGSRRLFSAFSKDQLYEEVKELGNPKGKKPKDVPQHFEVCEPCKGYLDIDDDIPLHLLAKLLKFKLLSIKTNDLKRRENERKAALEKEKLAAKVAEKAAGAGGGKERAKSPGKGKGGGKKTPEPQQTKDGSKLKKRGEEDPDGKFIDDEPDDGADHYILIHGFHQPHLFSLLAELGITVSNILRISSQDYSYFNPPESDEQPLEKDEKTIALEESAQEVKAKLRKELKNFWKDVDPVTQKNPKLIDIARKDYEVKRLLIPTNMEESEQKANFGTSLFEDIACMIYDLLDAKRQWSNYLENLKLVQVPVYGQTSQSPVQAGDSGPVSGAQTPTAQAAAAAAAGAPGAVPSLQMGDQAETPQVDMRYYNDLMNCIPQESASVPLIMHCMLEQVVATQENKEPPSEVHPPKRSDGLSTDLSSHLSTVAFKLALTEDEHNILADMFSLPERPPDQPKQPLLMNCNDNMTQRTHHLLPVHGFVPEKVEAEMLKRLPFNTALEFPRPTTQVAKERAARLQELIHFCATGGLSQSEIDRAFKQFVFESMDHAGTDSNGFIITRDSEGLEHSAIPWDDPYPFFKGMIPKHEKPPAHEMTPSEDDRSGAESDLFDRSLSVTPTSASELAEAMATPLTPPPAPRRKSPSPSGRKGKSKRPSSGSSDRKKGKKKGKSAQQPTPGEAKAPSPEEAPKEEPGSRSSSTDSRKGILRPSSRSSSRDGRRSRSPSVHFKDPDHHESHDKVHFEKDDEGHDIAHVKEGDQDEEVEEIMAKTMEESMNEIVDAQKRILDQWCFAEHYESKVLTQVLQEALYKLPFMDTYYHKRDHSLMVMLHNPFNTEFQNHVDWHTELHSNIGFRNYLDYVSESVADWTKEEEANYQAVVLSNELEKMREDEEASQKAADKVRQKSAKKGSRSKSPKSNSRGSSQDRPTSASSNIFIRDGSLKAWKIEQDKMKTDDEEKGRARSAKRGKSPKKEKEEKDTKKRPGSRGSAKSKTSGKEQEPASTDEVPASDEKFFPFSGYDIGNSLVHVSGITTTLFPCDGGQIRTERVEYVLGSTYVKTSILKDDHVFNVHIVDPKEGGEEEESDVEEEKQEEAEKAEFEEQEKDTVKDSTFSRQSHASTYKTKSSGSGAKKTSVSAFGSITAHLADGMTFALSQFGNSGEAADGKKYEPEAYIAPPTDPSPVPPAASPTKSKKGEKKPDKGTSTPEPVQPPPETEEKVEEKVEEPMPNQPFQQLFVSCPDGLNVKYMLESHVGIRPVAEDDRRLLVKQSYPYKTNGCQPCETARKKYALSEMSRVITSEGTVVKTMVDGSIMVLYADGTVSTHTGPWELPRSRDSSPQRGTSAKSQDKPDTPTKKPTSKLKQKKKAATDRSQKKGKQTTDVVTEEEPEEKKSVWVTTFPNGDRIQYKDTVQEDLKSIMICQASDPETQQSMATRDDHVMTISYPDGTTIVEHADGTRITTYYRESQVPMGDNSTDDGERDIEVQTNKFVKVECQAYATVEFNCLTSENLTIFGNGTTINIFPDGYYMMHHFDGGRVEVDTEGIVTYYPCPNKNMEQLLPERELRYLLCHNADVVVETVDPDGNVFNVRNNGDFTVIPVNPDDLSDVSSEDPMKSEKKVTVYKEHAPRFFVIHGDGSGTELLRYQDIAEYMSSAEQSPATAVLRDELPDFPGVLGITILKPYIGGPAERWLKKYDQESIVPPGIRCRDLTTLPPKEYKTPGPRFGTNVGQGLSVGAAVRPQIRIPIVKCPTILELRQFIQYKPMSEDLRSLMQSGLREYAEYVKSRNQMSDYMQVYDPRTEEERINAADLHSLAQVNQELASYENANVKEIYEKALTPPAPSPPPTPQPKRSQADWERDAREIAEEQEGLDAIKKKKIPGYFDSEFGKAFLLTQAKDITEMVTHLSDDPRTDHTAAVRADTFESKQSGPRVTSQSDRSSPASQPAKMAVSGTPVSKVPVAVTPVSKMPVSDTPMSFAMYSEVGHSASGMRPGNPTPAHAEGAGSPAPLRPQNPTPVHAQKVTPGRPGNPTPKQAAPGTESPSDLPSHLDYPIILEQPTLEEAYEEQDFMQHSLKMDILGQPRKESVPLPMGIKGSRPGAIPNTKYMQVEDPVRRRTNNSLVAGATVKGQTQLQQMRGLNLLPDEVDFGVLKEGNTYAFTVYLKNTGVDTCRYKLKQPPPGTGMRVIYKPGPIAAGMKADLNIEIYAIAVGVEGNNGVGSIRHDLEIVTETDVLFLPVSATVLTAYEYDNRNPNSPRGGKTPGARLVSTKPPSSTGIIRPRKNITLEPMSSVTVK